VRPVKYHRSCPVYGSLLLLGLLVVSSFESPIYFLSKTTWR